MGKQNLKLVDTPQDAVEPLFLSSVGILDAYWTQTAEVLRPCVEDAMHGEMTLQDIYGGIKAGRMFALVAKCDAEELPEVKLALILELHVYPQYTAMNIVALGGTDLKLLEDRFWKHVCSWAYMNGVRKMEASVSPVMGRMLRRLGFEKVYETVRMDIKEM